MSIELIVASVAITCALVLYTFGVFGERRSGTLSLRQIRDRDRAIPDLRV